MTWDLSFLWAQPTPEGVLRVILPNPPGRVDPTRPRLSQDRFVLGLVFETLVRLNSKNAPEPMLARVWFTTPEDRSITFTLDQKAKFSDGTPLTASDVAASIKRVCGPDSKTATDLFALDGCPGAQAAVEVLGLHKVRVRSKGNPAMLLRQLAYSFLFIHKVDGGRFIGSGYYTVADETPILTRLRRNPYYARQPQVANAGIDFEFVAKDQTEVALKSRAYHGTIMQLPSVATFTVPDGFRIHRHDPTVTLLFIMNPRTAAFSDIARRRQIISALQEAKLHECHTSVDPANGIIPRGLGGAAAAGFSSLPPPLREPLRRLPNETTVEIYRSAERQNACDQERITAVLREFNIRAQFVYFTNYDQFFRNWYAGTIDASLELLLFGAREAFLSLSRFRSGSTTNIVRLHDRVYDSMLDDVLKLERSDERFAYYRRLADRIADSALAVPLYYVGHLGMMRDCIAGLKQSTLNNPNPFPVLVELKLEPECRD